MYSKCMGAIRIKKPTELRKELFEILDESVKGSQFIVPHRSGESVIMGKETYYALVENLETSRSIQQGMLDYFEGRTMTAEDIEKNFASKFKKWRKKR